MRKDEIITIDNEKGAIILLQATDASLVHIISNDFYKKEKLARLFLSIYNKDEWNKGWVFTSGDGDESPDYYSECYELMMEHMRVDDCERRDGKKTNNPQKARDGALLKELKDTIGIPQGEDAMVLVNSITSLPSEEDHCYCFYVEGFRRVVSKHISQISTYRCNHPHSKLIFLLFDSSTAYVEIMAQDRGKELLVGDEFIGRPHMWWKDRRLVEVFEGTDIDCVIWFTPFKDLQSPEIHIPEVCVFDPHDGFEYEEYNIELMRSTEY